MRIKHILGKIIPKLSRNVQRKEIQNFFYLNFLSIFNLSLSIVLTQCIHVIYLFRLIKVWYWLKSRAAILFMRINLCECGSRHPYVIRAFKTNCRSRVFNISLPTYNSNVKYFCNSHAESIDLMDLVVQWSDTCDCTAHANHSPFYMRAYDRRLTWMRRSWLVRTTLFFFFNIHNRCWRWLCVSVCVCEGPGRK